MHVRLLPVVVQQRSYTSRREKVIQKVRNEMSKEYENIKSNEDGITIKVDPKAAKTFEVSDFY